jgi:hypothetical protein
MGSRIATARALSQWVNQRFFWILDSLQATKSGIRIEDGYIISQKKGMFTKYTGQWLIVLTN